MSKRDHEPVILDEFKGLYQRVTPAVPPKGYLSQAKNIVFDPRYGSVVDPPLTAAIGVRESILNAFTTIDHPCITFSVYEKSSGRRIIYQSAGGDIRDNQAADAIILTTGSTIDEFYGITLNDRFYFTIHDKVTGKAGAFVYVYDPSLSATARKIAGTKPGAGLAAAVSATNGTIEPGQHVYAVSFITNTGFITPPGSHVILASPAARKKTSLTGIPTGGASITKRRIWMSQVVRQYDGNIAAIPLFFVGDINDNATTTATVDAYDSQLVSSADPYLNLLEEVPAGTFLSMFDNRMVLCGENAAPYAIRVSNQNDPEAFDAINGVREIDRYNGGGVKTTRGLRGNLYAWKSNRTRVIKPINQIPAEWPVETVDDSLGAEPYAVSEANNNPSPVNDLLLVANPSGLFLFDGAYNNILLPLSWVIEKTWVYEESDSSTTKNTVLVVDSIAKRAYVMLGRQTDLGIFMMDYSNGLSYDKVKWSSWPANSGFFGTSMHVVAPGITSTNPSELLVLVGDGGGNNSVKKLSTSLGGNGTDDTMGNFVVDIEMPFIDEELKLLHLDAIKVWLSGGGFGDNMTISAGFITKDGVKTMIDQVLSTNFGTMKLVEFLFNATGQIVLVRFRKTNSQTGRFGLSQAVFFVVPVAQEYPM